jgi:hypothetical protein
LSLAVRVRIVCDPGYRIAGNYTVQDRINSPIPHSAFLLSRFQRSFTRVGSTAGPLSIW